MHEELFALQDALSKLDARGRGKRYTQDLKQQIIEHVRQRRETGMTWATLSEQLGVPAFTMSKWLKPDDHDQFTEDVRSFGTLDRNCRPTQGGLHSQRFS